MGVIVFGYHNMGVIGINALKNCNVPISAVFTHRENPNENIWFDSVSDLCKKKNIKFFYADDYNNEEILKIIEKLDPITIFSFYYRKIIPQSILDLPKYGAVNLHGSLLPKYRGRSPVNWQLINGEMKGGVTLHYMIQKPDAGDIIAQKDVPISEMDTPTTLFAKLEKSAHTLLNENINAIISGRCNRTAQDESKSSYYGGRKPDDGIINWKWNTKKIYNLIRAVTKPYPGAVTYLGNIKIIIWKATESFSLFPEVDAAEGTVKKDNGDFYVKTGDGWLNILEIEYNQQQYVLPSKRQNIITDGSLFNEVGKR